MTTKIRGTALAPGISRNGRYYSPAMIRDAVERAQPRVASGRMVMRSHHGAGDDTTRVVGRVTRLKVAADGSAAFEAELADTAAGSDIAALVRGPKPFVDGVSIAGYWLGKPRHVTVAGQLATTAEGVDIDAIDFTTRPGIPAARIVAESYAGPKRKRFLTETAPGPVTPAEGPTAQDYAAMDQETFDAVSGAWWGEQFAAGDERRAEGVSPFWRGLGEISAD